MKLISRRHSGVAKEEFLLLWYVYIRPFSNYEHQLNRYSQNLVRTACNSRTLHLCTFQQY